MRTLLPAAYFPPISYFAYLLRDDPVIESKEHFVKQSVRSRCTVLGANGPLNLLVPRIKPEKRQSIDMTAIHTGTRWQKLHWQSLDSAYRSSPYFEYYEDDMRPFFHIPETGLFQLNIRSIRLTCSILGIPFEPELTSEYAVEFDGLDMRNSWNKINCRKENPAESYPGYIQVFSDRHAFVPDLSILDLLFCVGPGSVDYLKSLPLNYAAR